MIHEIGNIQINNKLHLDVVTGYRWKIVVLFNRNFHLNKNEGLWHHRQYLIEFNVFAKPFMF